MTARTWNPPALTVTDHVVSVPLDHQAPDGEHISVYAREVVAAGSDASLPYLLFLQGGPGFEGPRPYRTHTPTWLEVALRHFRVLLLDQRGMGRSSPIGPADVERYGPQGLAQRLVHFRADSIVDDAELLRQQLGVERWAILGQSFGGFCVVTYLSRYPGSLTEAFITGGLPPLDRHIDDVYAATYRTTMAKTRRFYSRYPDDRTRMRELMQWCGADDVRLPDGDRLTPARLRQLGSGLGSWDGAEHLHHLLELPRHSPAFLHDVAAASPFARNPLYAVIHEACYAPSLTTSWAAQRTMPADYADDPTLLTGEHIFPWMFDDISGLAPFKETAMLLAKQPWGALYDVDTLSTNAVPCAAAVYGEDMYVDRALSEETAARIPGLRVWLTNEYEHDGLRASAGKVLERLIQLVRGQA